MFAFSDRFDKIAAYRKNEDKDMKKQHKPPSRANGEGNLTLKGKYWYARWMVDGVTYSRSTKCTVDQRGEAERRLQEFMLPYKARSEIERLEIVKAKIATQERLIEDDEARRRRVPVLEILDVYHERGHGQDSSDSTLRHYEYFFEILYSWLKKNRRGYQWMDDMTANDAEEYLSGLRKRFGPRSYNVNLKLFKWVWTQLKARRNIWADFPCRKLEPSTRRELTKEELKKIFDRLNGNRKKAYNWDLRLLIELGMMTGMRLGDCCHLKWSEVDLVKKLIVKYPHKTIKSQRRVVIPIHPTLLKELEAASKKREDGEEYVMPYIKHQYECRSVSARIRQLFVDAGVKTCERQKDGTYKPIVSFHSLRHSFVSLCAQNNMPQNMVMALVGHSTPRMTSKYYHQDVEQARKYMSYLPDPTAENQREMTDVRIAKDLYEKLVKLGGLDITATIERMLEEYCGE